VTGRHPEEFIHDSAVVVLPIAAVIWLEDHLDLVAARSAARSEPLIYNPLAAMRLAYLRHTRDSPVPHAVIDIAPLAELAPNSTQWLSTSAAADRLNITERAVRKRLERGQLNGKQLGGRWLIDADSLTAA
jgi:excisionase family DNA binding protein